MTRTRCNERHALCDLFIPRKKKKRSVSRVRYFTTYPFLIYFQTQTFVYPEGRKIMFSLCTISPFFFQLVRHIFLGGPSTVRHGKSIRTIYRILATT